MSEECLERAGGRRGRPLDRSLNQAILEAVLDCLAEVGYDRLTVDMVASRARAGRGALYRRWASKQEMVAEALADWKGQPNLPDTGSLKGDLEALLQWAAGSADPRDATVVCGLMSAAARDEDLARLMRERFVDPRRKMLRIIARRAMKRGEVPEGRDLELVSEVVPAFLFTRAVLYGETVTPRLLRTVVSEILYPLLVGPGGPPWEAEAEAGRRAGKRRRAGPLSSPG